MKQYEQRLKSNPLKTPSEFPIPAFASHPEVDALALLLQPQKAPSQRGRGLGKGDQGAQKHGAPRPSRTPRLRSPRRSLGLSRTRAIVADPGRSTTPPALPPFQNGTSTISAKPSPRSTTPGSTPCHNGSAVPLWYQSGPPVPSSCRTRRIAPNSLNNRPFLAPASTPSRSGTPFALRSRPQVASATKGRASCSDRARSSCSVARIRSSRESPVPF